MIRSFRFYCTDVLIIAAISFGGEVEMPLSPLTLHKKTFKTVYEVNYVVDMFKSEVVLTS